mmetsp:Transcript_10991/g.12559  ORF Transcript_10991/g.12559 Transcript_10991/m.12559 type:complete len:119 (+) Transcript_10991:99-455(+)
MKFSTFLLASLTLALDSGFVRGQQLECSENKPRECRKLKRTGECVYDKKEKVCGTCETYNDEQKACKKFKKDCGWDDGVCSPLPCRKYKKKEKKCTNVSRCDWIEKPNGKFTCRPKEM